MYEDMSDVEINRTLEAALYSKRRNGCLEGLFKKVHESLLSGEHDGSVSNYCSSWSDIGPLIDEYNVTIIQDTETEYPEDPHACIIGHYSAGGHMGIFEFCGEHASQAKKPKRAAAICILKKLEGEK